MPDLSNTFEYTLAELSLSRIRSTSDLSREALCDVPGLLQEAARDADPGNMFMRMFYILSALGQNELALEMQSKALAHRCLYRIAEPPAAGVRLLAIAGPGDMRDNTPLDFLIEDTDIRLDLLYVAPPLNLPLLIPDHHVAFIAIGAADKHKVALAAISRLLEAWPRPYINHPQQILNCARDTASALLQNIPGLHVPVTVRIHRGMHHGAHYSMTPDAPCEYVFPLTVRPIDSHHGKGLKKIDDRQQLESYFEEHLHCDEFFLSAFVDYQSGDGYYRKLRIALIDGKPFLCHLAISNDWIVNYANAEMESSAEKRDEEKAAMQNFESDFALRHRKALAAIASRLALDYVVIDCGETRQNELLFFEADPGGWVHATDSAEVFPYKPAVMKKAFDAFRALLVKRSGNRASRPK